MYRYLFFAVFLLFIVFMLALDLGVFHKKDHVIKVKSGDTMKRIAKRTLGDDMECYIEVYNNISSNQPLTEGQEIKIPKLETKKRLNKKNN